MKGMTRSIDDLGRIVIPMEIRKLYNLQPGAELQIEVVPGGLVLSPLNASCVICGGTKDLMQIDGTAVCGKCAEEIMVQKGKTQALADFKK